MAARATILWRDDAMESHEPTNNQQEELLLPNQNNQEMLYMNEYRLKNKKNIAYKCEYGWGVTSHQQRLDKATSQEELLEHHAKWQSPAPKREQRRTRQREDETPDEEVPINLMSAKENESSSAAKSKAEQTVRYAFAKIPTRVGGSTKLHPVHEWHASLLHRQPQTSFAVSREWIFCRPELQDRGTCHFHADYLRLSRLTSEFRVAARLV
jgi:hypothetical protein